MSQASGPSSNFHWMDIQQKTFTRWLNEHLKDRGLHVNDISKELSNGLALINLLEIISGKSIGRYNTHPKVPIQQEENCEIAVKFIQSEGLKLVNISGRDIHENRLKLILGLIWTLILRYEINKNSGGSGGEDELLKWIQSKIPSYGITNFTSDWNDGRALCALINALRPNLCGNHAALDPKNALENATTGITTAEDRMAIAPLIEPRELVHPKVDKQAVACYLAQFRNAGEFDEAHLCSAYGSGLVDGVVNEEQKFHVHTPPHGKGKIEIVIETPSGKKEVPEMKQAGNEFEIRYVPKEVGVYQVSVTYDGRHIPGSIFRVIIREFESLGGEGKVRVFFSTTSSSEKGRQDVFKLQELLTRKEIHKREDFEPWAAVDLMTREDREAVFKRAGTRNLPIIFIDDNYVGDFDTLERAEKEGRLDNMLKTMKHTSLFERDQERLKAGKK